MTTRQAYQVQTETPSLTEASLEEARELIGVWLRREHFRWNDSVAVDSIRQYCYGISDTNPLWLDEGHASGSRWGGILAPPTYLYSIDRGHVAPRLRGVQWIYAGADWTFDRPLHVGENVRTRARLIDANWVKGKRARRMILQEGEVLYETNEGDRVGRAVTKIFRIPRAKARGGLSYKGREPHQYTPDEIANIENDIDAEVVRGSEPRYWEDVHAGDQLQALVKGPLNMSDLIMFYAGTGCFYLAHEMAFRWRRRHPADAYKDPETRTTDHPARGHTEEFMAKEVGMPGRYDSGLQRVAWLGQVATNWMGDDSELLQLKVRLRRPNVFGDTQWCDGTVRHTREDEHGPVVDIDLRAVNQLGETTTEGEATVRLPVRKEGAPAASSH